MPFIIIMFIFILFKKFFEVLWQLIFSFNILICNLYVFYNLLILFVKIRLLRMNCDVMVIFGNHYKIETRKWTSQEKDLIYVKFNFEFLKRNFILILIKPSVGISV